MRKILIFYCLSFTLSLLILHSCKKEELPKLSTSSVTSITSSSATCGGNITSDGGADVIERGVCWSLNANPTTSDSKSEDGNGIGQFVSSITGLAAGDTYHVRAYAVNSEGTAYGADMTFSTLGGIPECITQPATNISATGVTLNGTVNANYASTTLAFEYGLTTSYGSVVTANQSPVSGNSITNVSAELTGLAEGTTYHFRIKAVNSIGSALGEDITFTTSGQTPTAITQSPTNVSTNSATLNGLVNANFVSTTVTFEYGLTASYGSSVNATPSPVTGNMPLTVNANIIGLNPGVTYHFRVKAVNSIGTAYGEDMSLTTTDQLPTAVTQAASNVQTRAATLNGTVNANNLTTTVTFEYGTTESYGSTLSATPNPVTGNINTAVSAVLTGLSTNTVYHYRVIASSNGGTAVGSDQSFTTGNIALATLTTISPGSITRNTALSGGNISSDGGGSITARGVCWSETSNPTTANPHTNDGTGISSFSSFITGLAANTYYHVRAYATNEAGTAYGNDIRFETAYTIPTVTTAPVTNITSSIATSGGNVLLQGGENVTAKGVCWNTTGNPSVADQHTTDGTGLGSFTSTMTGLTPNTVYFVRAYATNREGTAYGNETSFRTIFPNCGTVTDIDGNIYNTVIIGDRCWMQENLKTTRFNDGTEIRLVNNNSSPFDQPPWIEFPESTGYCWYNFDIGMKDIYGALYNSKATGSGMLCPVGWHVSLALSPFGSTPDDWHNMLRIFDPNADAEYLQPSQIAGGALKAVGTLEEGTGLWHYPNTGATNESGFTALPGGSYRNNEFSGLGNYATWWTVSSETRSLGYQSTIVGADDTEYGGRSVRCVKDY